MHVPSPHPCMCHEALILAQVCGGCRTANSTRTSSSPLGFPRITDQLVAASFLLYGYRWPLGSHSDASAVSHGA